MKLRWVLVAVLLVLMLVPASTLTVARTLQPTGGDWTRLIAFTPYAVPLYVAALFLLLTAWGCGRGVLRAAARIFTGVAVVGLVAHGVWLWPAMTGDPVSGTGSELRVMSANVKAGAGSPTRVVELALDNRVDILVVQEIDPAMLVGMEAAGLDEAFPHSAGDPQPGFSGTMVFTKASIGEVEVLGTGLGGYAMTVGDLQVLAVHARPPVGDGADWLEDHRAIRAAAADRAGAGALLVVGDLNATTDHAVLHELADLGLHDAAAEAGSRWQPTWPADTGPSVLGFGVPPMFAIDHVLVDQGYQVLRTETADVSGSDHRALIAILSR